MKKTKIVNILLLLVLCTSLFASFIFANSEDISYLSLSLVNQDPDPAIVGETVELRIAVTNNGGVSANNAMIEIDPEYPFELLTGEEAIQTIGSILGYQGYYDDEDTRIVKYTLKIDRDASAGTYDLDIKSYEEGGIPKISTLQIDVQSKESAEVIYIDKIVLIPGQEETLTFTINNVGSAPLRDLTFNWVNEDKIVLPVGSDNTRYLKYLDVGESAKFEYSVIADTNADSGLYELNLQLSYDDSLNNEIKQVNTLAGIYIGGTTDFDIAFSESSDSEMSFTVANIGSNSATSVSIIIPQQDGWTVTGSNSMIIGNLNTGDYTVASFTLQQFANSNSGRTVNQNRDKNVSPEEILSNIKNTETQNSLKMQIAYTDTRGNRETVEKEIVMNTQSSMTGDSTSTSNNPSNMAYGEGRFRKTNNNSFFSTYKYYLLGFIVLILLISIGIINSKYKKQKLLNPKLTSRKFIKNLLTKKKQVQGKTR